MQLSYAVSGQLCKGKPCIAGTPVNPSPQVFPERKAHNNGFNFSGWFPCDFPGTQGTCLTCVGAYTYNIVRIPQVCTILP